MAEFKKARPPRSGGGSRGGPRSRGDEEEGGQRGRTGFRPRGDDEGGARPRPPRSRGLSAEELIEMAEDLEEQGRALLAHARKLQKLAQQVGSGEREGGSGGGARPFARRGAGDREGGDDRPKRGPAGEDRPRRAFGGDDRPKRGTGGDDRPKRGPGGDDRPKRGPGGAGRKSPGGGKPDWAGGGPRRKRS